MMSLPLQSDIREREKPHERARYASGRSQAPISLPLRRMADVRSANRRTGTRTPIPERPMAYPITWRTASSPSNRRSAPLIRRFQST